MSDRIVETTPVTRRERTGVDEPRLCSRCRARAASTPRTAYCKPCRAAYQREWRARKDEGSGQVLTDALPASISGQRVRLRATPTRAEMLLYRLI